VGKLAWVISARLKFNLLRLADYDTLDNLEVIHDFAPSTP
jgi:hypothetical protein